MKVPTMNMFKFVSEYKATPIFHKMNYEKTLISYYSKCAIFLTLLHSFEVKG